MDILQMAWGVIEGDWKYFLSFCSALCLAWYARQTIKKKTTTELMFDALSSEIHKHYQKIYDIDNDKNQTISKYASRENSETDEAIAIRYVLNFWENVAVGVNNGIFSERILKESSYNTLLNAYEKTKPFIEEVNKGKRTKTIYQELSLLAKRWEKNKLKPKKRYRWWHFFS